MTLPPSAAGRVAMAALPEQTRPDYHPRLAGLLGAGISALAVAGVVGSPPASIIWMDIGNPPARDLASFRFALEVEVRYADAYLAFSEPESARDYPAAGGSVDLHRLATIFDVNRVICFLAITDSGQILCRRDYATLDLTHVEHLVAEFRQLAAKLDASETAPTSSALN